MKSGKGPALGVITFGVLLVLAAATSGPAQSAFDASRMDKHFVSEALKGGMAEVQMGQLATEKRNSNDVKEFGKRMLADHTKLGDQMKVVASQIGETAPTSPTSSMGYQVTSSTRNISRLW